MKWFLVLLLVGSGYLPVQGQTAPKFAGVYQYDEGEVTYVIILKPDHTFQYYGFGWCGTNDPPPVTGTWSVEGSNRICAKVDKSQGFSEKVDEVWEIQTYQLLVKKSQIIDRGTSFCWVAGGKQSNKLR